MAAERRRVVLLGAGHAHLHLLKQAAAFQRRGHELIIVAPDHFWYSGLATGMLGGYYPPSYDRIDIGALAARSGACWVRDRVQAIDRAARLIHLEKGPPVAYDLLSLNLGSIVPDRMAGATDAIKIKPIANISRLRTTIELRLQAASSERPLRVMVVGAGASAVEIAGNLARLGRRAKAPIEVLLGARPEALLAQFPRPAASLARRRLKRRGVRVLEAGPVIRLRDNVAVLADGSRLPFDLAVDATGLVPSPLIRSAGLPVDEDGALLVDDHLRSVGDPMVFGGGDCVSLQRRRLARIGVHAVRQGPVLLDNLLATLDGKPLRRFRPQRFHLLILNLGDGTALASWGPFVWSGRLAFRLKDWIDRRFLAQYRLEESGR